MFLFLEDATNQPSLFQTLMTLLLPMAIILAVFYFFVIRPEKNRQKQVAAMQSSIKKKDKIITIGGIYGIVDDVKDDVLTIMVASGARMKIERSAVKTILNRTVEESAQEDSKNKETEEETKETNE